MAEDKKKVMDVAKPGEAEPQTGSKPMVVGHRSMAADPSIKVDKDSAEEPAKPEEKLEPKKKLKIEPLNDLKQDNKAEKSEATSKGEDEVDNKPTKAPEKPKPDKETSDDKKAEDDGKDGLPEKKQDEVMLQNEERLQVLIKSKEYFVPIKESSTSATKTFILTFLIVGLLGIAAVAALIDAEILDLGIELPFDFL